MKKNNSGSKVGNILLTVVLILLLVSIWFLFKGKEKPSDSSGDSKVENQILGKQEDLVDFSVSAGSTLPASSLAFDGSIKGGWFFEANILINILDANKNIIKSGNATATSDWQTAEPVEFKGTIDLTGLPSGPAFFEIHNDNASGEPQFDKFIQIPIILQ